MVKRFVEAHITRDGDTEMQEAVAGPWVRYEDTGNALGPEYVITVNHSVPQKEVSK